MDLAGVAASPLPRAASAIMFMSMYFSDVAVVVYY